MLHKDCFAYRGQTCYCLSTLYCADRPNKECAFYKHYSEVDIERIEDDIENRDKRTSLKTGYRVNPVTGGMINEKINFKPTAIQEAD